MYQKPALEIIELQNANQILAGSGGDFNDNKIGDGTSTSEGGGVDPISGGSRAPEFFDMGDE